MNLFELNWTECHMINPPLGLKLKCRLVCLQVWNCLSAETARRRPPIRTSASGAHFHTGHYCNTKDGTVSRGRNPHHLLFSRDMLTTKPSIKNFQGRSNISPAKTATYTLHCIEATLSKNKTKMADVEVDDVLFGMQGVGINAHIHLLDILTCTCTRLS